MSVKIAQQAQRSSEISDEERQAARKVISAFNSFLKKLFDARNKDAKLVNVLERSPDTDPAKLFDIRHLLRRFQKEVKQRYTDLIFDFAGQKDGKSGLIQMMTPLEKDTKTRQIKSALQDAMQQLTEFMEEFLEAFEDFSNKEQIKSIILISKKADQLAQSIENIIDKQLKTHFQKNILKQNKVSEIRGRIRRRARLLKMMEA